MNLNLSFAKYEGAELESFGTVASIVGAKGKLAIAPKSLLKNNTKRVVIIMTKKDGTSSTVTCSSKLSDAIRTALEGGMTKVKVLAIVAKLEVLQAEDDATPFVTIPQGESTLEQFTVEDLAKEKAVDYGDLVAF